MSIFKGNLSKIFNGTANTANCAISATEVDSGHTVIVYTTAAGNYKIELEPGSWKINLTETGQPPKYAGILQVNNDSPGGSLDQWLTKLKSDSLDITVLGHLYNLVERSDRVESDITQKINTATNRFYNTINDKIAATSATINATADKLAADLSAKIATTTDAVTATADSLTAQITEKITETTTTINALKSGVNDKIAATEARIDGLQSEIDGKITAAASTTAEAINTGVNAAITEAAAASVGKIQELVTTATEQATTATGQATQAAQSATAAAASAEAAQAIATQPNYEAATAAAAEAAASATAAAASSTEAAASVNSAKSTLETIRTQARDINARWLDCAQRARESQTSADNAAASALSARTAASNAAAAVSANNLLLAQKADISYVDEKFSTVKKNTGINSWADMERIIESHKKWLAGDKTGERADFTGVIYKKANLTNQAEGTFANIDFSRANFDNADFTGCEFNNVKFNNANLFQAILKNCTFTTCDFSGGNMTLARFDGSNMSAIKFDDAVMNEASLKDVTGSSISINRTQATSIVFIGAVIENLEIFKCNMPFSYFNSAKMSGSLRIDNSNLEGAWCHSADFAFNNGKINFVVSNFKKSTFNSSNLTGALIDRCDMTKAAMRDTTVNGAKFNRTELLHADFLLTLFYNVSTGSTAADRWATYTPENLNFYKATYHITPAIFNLKTIKFGTSYNTAIASEPMDFMDSIFIDCDITLTEKVNFHKCFFINCRIDQSAEINHASPIDFYFFDCVTSGSLFPKYNSVANKIRFINSFSYVL